MSLTVFLAVLGAALLHASWNGLIKFGESKVTAMLIMTLLQGGAGLVIALTREWPDASVWPWLAASGVLHAAYKIFLAYAYEQGDLSRVYPIARGTAPMIVLAISVLFLADQLTTTEVAGILVLGLGISMMSRGAFLSGESRKLVPFALGSAVATAGYSIVDGIGARASGDAVQYVAWLFLLDALLFSPVLMVLRGTGIIYAPIRAWIIGGIAAAGSYGAYAIAVWAMTIAPIALVAALRETSILFAILIGWLLFGERVDRLKAAAAAAIVTGVAATRL
jgi:drug/metabolite transporter (DMT)-like permease